MTLTYGSLFAGIGGFDLAADRAGLRGLWQVEIDAAARSVLQRHWPDVPKYADVRECGAHNLARVDVVMGGFPCQDVSVAGARAGFDGARSVLFYEMVRIVDELRPRFLVWENVPGLLSSRNGADFWHVLNALDGIGYCGAWTSLDAQWFGLAQRRQRVFGVFAQSDIGAGRCAEILSFAARLSGHPKPRRETGQGIAGTLTGGIGGGRSHGKPNGSDRRELVVAQDVVAALTSSGRGVERAGESRGQDPVIAVMPLLAAPRVARQAKGPFTDPEHDNIIVISQNGSDVQTNDKPGALTSAYERGTSGPVLAFEARIARNGRGAPSGIVPPLKAQNGGTGKGDGAPLALYYSHEYRQDSIYATDGPANALATSRTRISQSYQVAFGVRRLTPTECERLQGFPDGHTAGQSDSARYRQLGNAVAVPVVEWIMRRVAATED